MTSDEKLARDVVYSIGCDLGVVGVIDWKDTLALQKLEYGIAQALSRVRREAWCAGYRAAGLSTKEKP